RPPHRASGRDAAFEDEPELADLFDSLLFDPGAARAQQADAFRAEDYQTAPLSLEAGLTAVQTAHEVTGEAPSEESITAKEFIDQISIPEERFLAASGSDSGAQSIQSETALDAAASSAEDSGTQHRAESAPQLSSFDPRQLKVLVVDPDRSSLDV